MAVDAAELKAMLALARKREVNFGLCLGKKPENTVFELDRKKAPNLLGRQARKAGETAKVACGVVTVSGKLMTLKCEEDPPSVLAKQTKLFLRFIGMPMKVCIADAEGNILEADEEDEEQGATNADAVEAPESEEGDPNKARWEKVAPELGRRVEQALANAAQPDKLKTVWAFAQSKADAGDFGAALGALKVLMPLLAPAAAADNIDDELAKIGGALKELLTANPKLGAEVKAMVQIARNKEASPADRAQAIAGLQATIVADPLVVWRDAKELVDQGLIDLQQALSGAKHPDLLRIAEFGLNGVTEGNQTAMMAALMDFNRQSAGAKAAAADTLAKRAAEYRQFIVSNAVISLCENNPLGIAVSIKPPLLKALDKIEFLAQKAAA